MGSNIFRNFHIYNSTLFVGIPWLIILVLTKKRISFSKQEVLVNRLINTEIHTELAKLSKFRIKTYLTARNDLNRIEREKLYLDKKEYLAQLIALRDRLSNI